MGKSAEVRQSDIVIELEKDGEVLAVEAGAFHHHQDLSGWRIIKGAKYYQEEAVKKGAAKPAK